jgi:hypothetical protein
MIASIHVFIQPSKLETHIFITNTRKKRTTTTKLNKAAIRSNDREPKPYTKNTEGT